MITEERITLELIERLKTPRGNFTNGALLALTGTTRPKHGWRKKLEARIGAGEILYAIYDPSTVMEYAKQKRQRSDANAYAALNRRMRSAG